MYNKTNIAFEILAYLVEHPDARDTADGIAQWWILEQCVKRQAPLVNEAIDYLVEKKFIVGHKAKDSKTHYRINRLKVKEVAALLKQIPRQ